MNDIVGIKWVSAVVNKTLITRETENALLIKMPRKSGFNGFSFWFPKGLSQECENNSIFISAPHDSIYTIRKYGKGLYNKTELLNEIKVDAKTLFEAIESSN